MSQKVCKYFPGCPMREFLLKGKLEKKWVENYCFNNHKNCKRYERAEKGNIAPDNMLPNGEIREDLK